MIKKCPTCPSFTLPDWLIWGGLMLVSVIVFLYILVLIYTWARDNKR